MDMIRGLARLVLAAALASGVPSVAAASEPEALVSSGVSQTQLQLTSSGLPVTTGGRWVGFYQPGAPLETAPLSGVEARVGRNADVVNYFQYTAQGFTAEQAGNAVEHGGIPMITLEMWEPGKGANQPAYSLRAIANGSHDAYLRSWARGAKRFGHVVWLRLFHEMNGDWYPWCGTVNGNTPADFIAAWRHVRAIFTAEGATNVKFVWCPNIDSIPNTSANAISRYWPGEAYVDFMALDGYNFGDGQGLRWRSFSSLFAAPYAQVTALSDKPLFVAETGCATYGGDKAAWIADMFRQIPTRFPRIVGVSYFNARKDRDWRIESSGNSLQAYRDAVMSGPFAGRGSVPRLAGQDRFSGAVSMARATYGSWDGVRTIVIASGEDRAAADPLAAAGLCWAYDAPLFLVGGGRVPPDVKRAVAEIARANGSVTVRVVGGPASVSGARLQELYDSVKAATGVRLTWGRVASGGDRYQLAAAIADEVRRTRPEAPRTALLANGADATKFSDALALSAVSRATGAPVLLVSREEVPRPTQRALDALRPTARIVAGGPATVSDAVLRRLGATRWSGRDRYATAASVAKNSQARGWTGFGSVGIAAALPDALAGGTFVGRSRGTLLLTRPDALSSSTASLISAKSTSISRCTVLGGRASLAEAVRLRVSTALLGN